MTHQILDDVSDYGLKHVVGEETIEAGHELIDKAFGTDYASEYTEESKEAIASLKKELGMEGFQPIMRLNIDTGETKN